jgi:hypothetical protein
LTAALSISRSLARRSRSRVDAFTIIPSDKSAYPDVISSILSVYYICQDEFPLIDIPLLDMPHFPVVIFLSPVS